MKLQTENSCVNCEALHILEDTLPCTNTHRGYVTTTLHLML
jgi:hypothetical protein